MLFKIKNWAWDEAQYELTDDYEYETDKHEASYTSPGGWLEISAGEWMIKKGFKWNGTTAVPDGPNHPDPNSIPVMSLSKHPIPLTWEASLVHDVGCKYIYEEGFPYTRKEVDQIFYALLKKINFKYAKLYYIGVRLFGIIFGKLFHVFGVKI